MARPDIERAIEEVLTGNREAFSVIVKTFNDELWKLVSYYLPDRSRVEDVVQRSFIAFSGAWGEVPTAGNMEII